MKKALIIIDMQNDFVTGSLANPDAVAIVTPIVAKIAEFDGDIIATRDTHAENYLETVEGKHLPIPHCIEGTEGWDIVPEIRAAMEKKGNYRVLDKTSFGMIGPWSLGKYDSIEVVGTCTDICGSSCGDVFKGQWRRRYSCKAFSSYICIKFAVCSD